MSLAYKCDICRNYSESLSVPIYLTLGLLTAASCGNVGKIDVCDNCLPSMRRLRETVIKSLANENEGAAVLDKLIADKDLNASKHTKAGEIDG